MDNTLTNSMSTIRITRYIGQISVRTIGRDQKHFLETAVLAVGTRLYLLMALILMAISLDGLRASVPQYSLCIGHVCKVPLPEDLKPS